MLLLGGALDVALALVVDLGGPIGAEVTRLPSLACGFGPADGVDAAAFEQCATTAGSSSSDASLVLLGAKGPDFGGTGFSLPWRDVTGLEGVLLLLLSVT